MLSLSLIDLVKSAAIECGSLLKSASSIVADSKPHWTKEEDAGFGGIVTKWDSFVQDFIAGRVKAHFPEVRILAEEEAGLFNDGEFSEDLTIIIDPIDGTEWFVRGEYEYSVLVTILVAGVPQWSIGIFPKKSLYFIGDSKKLQEFPSGRYVSLVDSVSIAERMLTAHYRIARPPHSAAYETLMANGYHVKINGDGFGTNLSAVEMLVNGEASAFIASKMSIIDGFITAHLIESAGGAVQFFDVTLPIGQWVETSKWSCHDFGTDVGRRARFIAAVSDEVLSRVLKALI